MWFWSSHSSPLYLNTKTASYSQHLIFRLISSMFFPNVFRFVVVFNFYHFNPRFYQKYNELRARIKANSCPILPAGSQTQTQPAQQHATVVLGTLTTSNQSNQKLISNSNYSVQRSASLKDHAHFRFVFFFAFLCDFIKIFGCPTCM